MSDNKRQSSELIPDTSKKIKVDTEDGQSIQEHIEQLKHTIKQELSDQFKEQFEELKNQYNELKAKYDGLEKRIKALPPPLPYRETSKPTIDSKNISLTSVKTKDTPSSSESGQKPKHTFGGTSFQISTTTPNNSFKVDSKGTVKDVATPNGLTLEGKSNSPALLKPVFGASTTFGSSLNLGGKKNVFDELPAGSSSGFGSKSKFSNAFQKSLQKKSFLEEDDNNADNSDSTQEIIKPETYKQVDLEPVKNSTGEENETSHFTATCKLFELNFNKMSEGWKERGLGPIHLNQSVTNPSKVRLVMRSNGLLRVILNSAITSSTEIFKGLEASLTPEKYMRFNSVVDSQPVQFLLKFGTQSLRDELVGKIDDLKQHM